jgi:hypothetical protein
MEWSFKSLRLITQALERALGPSQDWSLMVKTYGTATAKDK